MLELESRGIIYDAAARPPHERTGSFTSLRRMRSGAIVASFQVGPRKHAVDSNVKLFRSDDGGRTWRELPPKFSNRWQGVRGSLSSGELVEGPAGEWLVVSTWFDRSDPQRPLFDPQTEGILHSRQLTAVSRDEGQSWSDWREIATPGLTGCAATGPLLAWDDGTLAYAFESFKEYDDPSPARHAAWLLISRDGGQTFPERHLVARDPQHQVYYWDQRLCPAGQIGDAGPGSEYVAMFWTHDRQRKQDLRVHLRFGALTDESEASLPVETSIPGQIAAPLLLADGRLLAFVVDRSRPGTMTLWCSADRGRTWPVAERLVVYTHNEQAMLSQGAENVNFAQYWEDMGKWTFGHPAICPVDDAHVLVAFYAGTPECLSVHWGRVRI
ncbi:MAG: exo-alpha-sialidase [Planctomycetaceae bacterium]|nr:exo-alpha-sialidase [Planctomycetaceae bacterium]